jgi:predicted MPP superfamily phosphohydrolase
LHIGTFYSTTQLKKVVNKVNLLKPDLLCFTGDLVEDSVDILNHCIPILKSLHAPLGKIAILGNHDYRIGKQADIIDCLKRSGFTFLKNNYTYITKMGSQLFIAGVDDMFSTEGGPDIPAAIKGITENRFTILLAHEPDLADEGCTDLQLSGHSQVRLPFYGPVFTPDGVKKYIKGFKKIASSTSSSFFM